MGQGMMVRRGGSTSAGTPTYTFTGNSQITDEGNGNWNIQFRTSGTFTCNQNASIQVFLLGGGGAGNQNGGAGGGGYNATSSGISLLRNVPYTISVGSGGTSSGAAGSQTTAFNNTGSGGGGGVAGTITGQTCVVIGTSGAGGNVYYYSSLKASAVSIGSGQRTVNLAFPITGANHNNGTYLLKGVSGYYRCNIVSHGALALVVQTGVAELWYVPLEPQVARSMAVREVCQAPLVAVQIQARAGVAPVTLTVPLLEKVAAGL